MKRYFNMPKAKSKLPKWYSVKVGRRPGVYETWPEAEKQVSCSVKPRLQRRSCTSPARSTRASPPSNKRL